ncbi:TATA box-binding protein-associated factor RNA polymerase I subunit B-like [Malania oleifera]|uniref:TATA box-binding protein-associated factor RNA polymerase I subunit B-like n=1 Tax=Malania oleifera TaxID=397392 RepID=UPI0025ADF1B7|nr:TATA box-binding protein-associated factor RNA polymerase I subunit B-like [Malania oleifera]
MATNLNWTCQACGNVGFDDGSTDGFFYCLRCGAQAEDIIDTGVADEDFIDKGDAGSAIYLRSHRRQQHSSAAIKVEPVSQSQSVSQFWNALKILDDENGARAQNVKKEEIKDEMFVDGVGPTEPADFGQDRAPSFDDYYSEVRMRYVMGVQLMIQMQCKALVEKFNVSPLICGLSGTIWLRFVAATRVFDDGWADEVVHESESQNQGDSGDYKSRVKYGSEPHNIFGQRAVMIWYRSLNNRIPLSCSLGVSFLACHVAREAILPTDILKWSLEGKLPYLAAFVDIEKFIGPPTSSCPLSSSVMFRPSQPVPLQKLESQAASIAQSIGLDLPPVNFYAIAYRYLMQLSLPAEKILPHACRIYDWLLPPDLWLSVNELRLPTRVCVMSILIVAIRILYNINGFGFWEMNLSRLGGSSFLSDEIQGMDCASNFKTGNNMSSPSHKLDDLGMESIRDSSRAQKSEMDAAELLHNLEVRYNEIGETSEYSKDLPTYLQYCKDVVFAGLEPSFENYEEEKIIEQLWDFYQNQKDSDPSEELEVGCSNVLNQKRPRDDEGCISQTSSKENKKIKHKECRSVSSLDVRFSLADDCSLDSMDGDDFMEIQQDGQYSVPSCQTELAYLREEAIKRLKLNMEENNFCYIPPRINLKRFDYLHYVRKRDDGSLTYVAHADYYILLRACARAAQVDVRIMHVGVLSFERRLAWTENRIDHCLHLSPPNVSCKFCSNVPQQAADDPIGFSNLNL